MDLERKIYKTYLNGEEISLEISKLAGKATAAVLGRYGETAVLAAVVMGNHESEADYFPLTVDYEERFYAAGKIIGSRFIRREGRPSEEAILSARLIDRTIRPLFNRRLRRDVQVTLTVLAYDEKNDPDVISLLAASTALGISKIPWNGPVAGVKIAAENYTAFFAGPVNKINMIEFEGLEISEEELIRLFQQAQQKINELIKFQQPIIKELGKTKLELPTDPNEPIIKEKIKKLIWSDLLKFLQEQKLDELKTETLAKIKNELPPENAGEILKKANDWFEDVLDDFIREQILKYEKRPDGRRLDQIRDLYAEAGLFKRTHGSAIFVRGETQILAITTLASPSAEQLIETMEYSGKRRFMLHYNFPGFSSGEINRAHSPGRREIGHGNLAAKAINAVLPTKEEFPYTIRIVAETLSSNGSTSMATVCAASLSLMDAGVPIKDIVGGIAIGLMTDPADLNNFKLLTDIQGPEDHHGEMDFKTAGTRKGITAIQMDVKNEGINLKIFTEALSRAKIARTEIISFMEKILAKPRPQLSPLAPKIMTISIPKEKIGEVIGPGGRIINGIIAACQNQVTIDIEENGQIFISGHDEKLVEEALKAVKNIVHEYQVGEIVEGVVIKILDFGAIVDLGGGRDGMIHISEFKDGFVKKIEDIVKVGDRVKVKIIRVEPDGRIALSIRQL